MTTKIKTNSTNSNLELEIPAGLIPEGEEHNYLIIESDHPAMPHKLLHRKQVHESVFEANYENLDHPDYAFMRAVFCWIAPEYHQYYKTMSWWVIAGLVFLFAVIAEAISGNWSMLLATVVYGVVYWLIHQYHPPKHTKIILSDAGVRIGKKTIPYASIRHFGIIYDPPFVKRLHFELKQGLLADIAIELEGQDPKAIKQFLRTHLPEHEDFKEHLSDIILRILKL